MLVEIHMLQNYAPSNLNRDETGSPKDCVFGGSRRGRISSQSLKRSIRRSDVFQQAFSADELAVRTRRLPEEVGKILASRGIDEKLVKIAQTKVTGFGNRDGKENADGVTAQVMFLNNSDVLAVADAMEQVIKDCDFDGKNLQKAKAADIQKKAELKGYRPISPDIALFGRMITSPAFEDVQASMQVAHAISTHRLEREFDYFTAVDDLNRRGEADESETEEKSGAGMIGDVEFNSSLYYKYYSLDVAGMLDNLTGVSFDPKRKKLLTEEEKTAAHKLMIKTLGTFLTAAVFTSPSGKQNSFAAHQLPEAILIEVRQRKIPISYANAFLKAVNQTRDADLMEKSITALKEHVEMMTRKFSLPAKARLWFSTRDCGLDGVETCGSFDELVKKLTDAVSTGE